MAMVDKTILAVPGKKLTVPRVIKRTLQVVSAVALTAAVALACILGNGMLIGRGSALQGINLWLAFIKRTDIQATTILTALVTVLFVYWQRDRERR